MDATEVERFSRYKNRDECAERDPVAQAILSHPRVVRHPYGACAKCFHPIFRDACPLCGLPLGTP